MSLPDDIQTLRDRVLADLIAAHDYYKNTKIAWQIVRKNIKSGPAFTIRNAITGTTTKAVDLQAKSRSYVSGELTEATFQQFLSIFEGFFFDLLRLWLMAYPQSLIGRQVNFKEVLDAPDKDALTNLVIDKELNDILYERPAGWFKYLDGKVKLGCPSPDEIARIAEAKASRDVLVHNGGIASKTYQSKAGSLARCDVGERMDFSEPYHRATWELIRKVISDVSNAAIAKVS